MPRPLLVLLALAAIIPPAHATAVAPAPIGPNESRTLLRSASRLSGLPVKRAVAIVEEDVSRFRATRARAFERLYSAADRRYDDELYTALGLSRAPGLLEEALAKTLVQQAFYDLSTRKVYVSRGRASRAAVVQQLVIALQDQSFRLGPLRLPATSRDARSAAAAALAGHAALVAPLPVRASPSGPRLDRFLELEIGFPATVGLRLAADLRNLGGTKAVFAALRRFPQTTEQVFHVDAFLDREPAVRLSLPVDAAGLALAGDDTFGELDVRALLAVFGVPRLAQAGAGWGGGRSAIYRRGATVAAVLALDWDSELDARQWAEAVQGYVTAAFDRAPSDAPGPTPCGATTCWSRSGHAVAFERDGSRTALVLGADLDGAAELAKAVLGGP
jgi:hypothetical protein